jgi:hypothetical protein
MVERFNKLRECQGRKILYIIRLLVFLLPAGFAFIYHNDYSGRCKTEIVLSKCSKKFVGYHFLNYDWQLAKSLINKRSFDFQIRECQRDVHVNYKNQLANFLRIRDFLSEILHLVLYERNRDFEKLFIA